MGNRVYLVFSFFLLFFSLVIIKLFYLQVLSFDRLIGMAEKQRSVKLPIPAFRGRIFSSDKSPLVINQKAYGIYFEPHNINEMGKVVSLVAKSAGIDESSISAKIENKNLNWVPIAHKIEEDKITDIKTNHLEGIELVEESKRFYPEASMAAQLLGFVGKDSQGNDSGYFGIEGFYNQQLKGRDGYLQQEIDATGKPILTGEIEKIPAESGRDLILHLDKTIQYVIEKKLADSVEKFQAKGGSVIVMDPYSGGIIASASVPSYDPGAFSQYSTDKFNNPVIAQSYEPGSTFKTLVMTVGLNEGKIQPESKFNEEGPLQIGGYFINTWNQKYHGSIDTAQILEYSSNVGMVYIQKLIDKNIYYDYLKKLGLGQLTNVDLQEEAIPDLRPIDKWYEIDYATSSFGQGIAVTPLQMVRAVSAIANGGDLMEPHVVKSILLPNGESINIPPKKVGTIFKPLATKIMKEMMVEAVDNGEAKRLKPAGYRIAGKTGTAQIPIAGHYDASKTIASFVGFAPVDKPRFVMLVTIREPATSIWGSETAAPLFFSIAKEIFSYLKISPNE